MINLKVKTLDSQTHDFEVEDEVTVKEFKEHIATKVSITADLQRLIYCGRVLNDEKKLKDYDVNGKCLHLVQRAPPSSTASSTSASDNFSGFGSRNVNMGMPDFENMMSFSIPMASNIVGPPHTTTSLNPSSTLCGNRITVARHMLNCADNIAAYLENPENGLNNQNMDLLAQQTMESTVLEVGISAVTDADLPQQDVQNIVQAFQGAVSAAFRQNGINNITVQQNDSTQGIQVSGTMPSANTTTASSSITIEFPSHVGENSSSSESATSSDTPTANVRPRQATATAAPSRQQTTSTQILGEVVGQMQTVQRRLDPFIQQYHDILQNDPTYADDAARETAQRVFDRVSEALHYMSHAQHAISDLMLDLNLQTPRHLCCRPILVEQSAFVSSGISAPTVGVGSIQVGPIFARGNISGINNNNNNNATPNNNQQGGQATNNANNADNFASSLLSAFGFTSAPPPAPSAPPATNNQSNNSTNTTTTSTTASAGSNNQNQQDHDDDEDSLNQDDASQASRDRYRNFLQNLMSQPNAEVQIINANISLPVPQTGTQTPTTNTAGSTENGAPTADATQARVNSNTQPTTSTQTRSTSRPMLTSTTLPPTSIRNFRPVPTNILSSFDRFLPCNSHHIRDNSASQQQQNQQTQTIHVRPAQRRAVSLDRNASRLPAATIIVPPIVPRDLNWPPTQSRTRRIVDGINDITEDELNHHFSLFGIEFSLRDLDNLAPSFYNAQRNDLRSYLRQNYFVDREINEETVTVAIRDILTALDQYLHRLSNFSHQDYDVRKSIENLIMKSLPFIINLITDDNSNEFGTRIERQLITFCENVYMILVKCIGVPDTEQYLNEIANMVMIGGAENLSDLGRFPRYIIKTFLIERRSYDLSEIQEFLIIKRPSAPTPIVSRNEQIAMEVDEEPQTVSPMEAVEEEHLADESSNNLQAEDIAAEPLPPIDRAEPWHAQFSSSWLPIITRDIARQQRQGPPRPYSDAYISGMSSKRRKVFQSRRPPTNVQQLVADGVRQVIASTKKAGASSSTSAPRVPPTDEIVAAISSDPGVLSAYRDEVKACASQRLKTDPDYDEAKPNSSKAFK